MANMDSSDTPTPDESRTNSASTTQETVATEAKTRRKIDPSWGYCTQYIEEGRKKIKCMYCNMVFGGGGIHRFKEHLAKWPGSVVGCSKVNPEVEHTMYQNIKDWNEKKRKAQEEYQEEHPYGPEPIEVEEEEEACDTGIAQVRRVAAAPSRGRKKVTTPPSVGKYFKPRTNPGDQPTIKSVLQGEAVKLKTDLCVTKWFIDASLPFNASNSIFYQPMLDAVCAYGSGYKGPNFNQLRGPLVTKCVEETKNFVDGFRKIWRETGCTIMADGWTDRKRRTHINFLVYCPKAFHASRDEIVKRFQRKKEFVRPFLDYIDARWDKHFDKNLHAAGFWFNPNNQYNEELREKYKFTTSGILDVIEKYDGKDFALRSALTREMKIFRQGDGDFGRSTAKNDRQHMLADEWWQTYGCTAPQLQKLALRVLSQTCSASGCERNWSLFEHVHSKKRNRLEHQRLNDIIYVHCNLRLHQRSKTATRNYDPISLDEIQKGNEAWIVEDNPPRLNSDKLSEFRNKLAALSIQCSEDLVLNLDEVEADAMEESEAMAADQEHGLDDLDMFLGGDVPTSSHNVVASCDDDWPSFY